MLNYELYESILNKYNLMGNDRKHHDARLKDKSMSLIFNRVPIITGVGITNISEELHLRFNELNKQSTLGDLNLYITCTRDYYVDSNDNANYALNDKFFIPELFSGPHSTREILMFAYLVVCEELAGAKFNKYVNENFPKKRVNNSFVIEDRNIY
ncbi:MAG: hypothetical protein EKK57_07295 [Proteobacteria bacterium]|nr:MAG: hypothetical protein EKK57_07295 [Pseudomonadota bacterium]